MLFALEKSLYSRVVIFAHLTCTSLFVICFVNNQAVYVVLVATGITLSLATFLFLSNAREKEFQSEVCLHQQ
jgi:hypothetical protein